MRYSKDKTGRFSRRLYFEDGEIDSIMDAVLDETKRPRIGALPAIDIEKVMLRLDLEPTYSELPHGVLGATSFEHDGTSKIVISCTLAESAHSEQPVELSLRTTQAHELGHAKLHRSLYISNTPSLFNEPLPAPIQCREKNILNLGYNGEWWEFQANAAMAAVLMPRSEFLEEAAAWTHAKHIASLAEAPNAAVYSQFISEVATRFQVSRTAVRYRAEGLKMNYKEAQPGLQFSR
ncbi:MAG: ImmA/IrrE family metallo-endopeptidase [Elusimicrobiota bacterium]